MFTLISTAAKSFIGERKGIFIYYYSIASPQAIILSKILYNTFLAITLSIIGLGLFSLFLGNPIEDLGVFMLIVLLAAFGFAASCRCFIGHCLKDDQSSVLMAILSFPVIISILFVAIQSQLLYWWVRGSALVRWSNYTIAINCLIAAVSYLLFVYLAQLKRLIRRPLSMDLLMDL